MMKSLRIYVDTSVFGGCFDQEFQRESLRFFDLVRKGRVTVLVSEIVVRELTGAPDPVKEFYAGLPLASFSRLDVTEDVIALRDAYIAAGVVGRRSLDDATQ